MNKRYIHTAIIAVIAAGIGFSQARAMAGGVESAGVNEAGALGITTRRSGIECASPPVPDRPKPCDIAPAKGTANGGGNTI